MRPLVLCYSLNGWTAALGRELAYELDAEFGEILCKRYEGLGGRLRLVLDIALNRTPLITLPDTPIAARQIILGGAVWSARACTPVLALLEGQLRACYDLMLFLSYGPMEGPVSAERAIADAREVLGVPFRAYAAVPFADLDPDTIQATAQRLAGLFHIPFE